MRIKPTYDVSYLIRYRRNKDVQTTEIVEATRDEVCSLISRACGENMAKTKTGKFIPQTRVVVQELDNVNKQSGIVYGASVYNLSPREVRIRIEKAIANQ